MRVAARAVLVLAGLAALVCLATGAVYIVASSRAGMPDLGPWLATLGGLGATALGAVGVWQHQGEGLPRLIALVVLSALAAGYVAANAFALIQGSEIPQTPRPLHTTGLIAGGALYLVGLIETTHAFRGRRGPEG